MTPVRCAIYTRKSSEEGLEQGFNSLDAQREACAAYILSQASEGWECLPQHYDDGGISGGTLDRPALQQLLGDVQEGRIDIIVVYKVDRLTRSLLDFAKLVEALDKAGTSFVSITQAFNTTTSMGRLTLNMLLSFAQFEREVTAERIRDKLAASKAKGMWMGGIPPLGYKPDGRSLAIVEHHAELIRMIYARYRALGKVRLVADELVAQDIRTPLRKTGTGRSFGDAHFSRGQIYAILKNPIYAGDIAHRDKIYPGAHAPIIERELWEKVQSQLAGHVKGGTKVRAPKAAPLAGKILDAEGEAMLPTHTNKGKQRYRYYVSKSLHHGEAKSGKSGMRLPAGEIEQLVGETLAVLFDDPIALAEQASLSVQPADVMVLVDRAGEIAAQLRQGKEKPLTDLLAQLRISATAIELDIAVPAIARLLKLDADAGAPALFTHIRHVRLTRTGRAVRLVQNSGALATQGEADPALLRLLARARSWWQILCDQRIDVSTLASQEGVSESYVSRVLRLAFLSPQVVDALIAGRLRAGIDSKALLRIDAIDPDWEKQAALLARL